MRIDRPVLSGAREDGLAEGDRLEVVAAGDVGLGPVFERPEETGHGAGEGVGEPGFGPSGAVPGAVISGGRVVEGAGDPGGPVGPADRAEGQAVGPLDAPADADVGGGPLVGRAVPDVVPGGGAGPILEFEDVEVDAILVCELRPGIGPGAGEDADRVAQPVSEGVEVVDAHDEGGERAAPFGPG